VNLQRDRQRREHPGGREPRCSRDRTMLFKRKRTCGADSAGFTARRVTASPRYAIAWRTWNSCTNASRCLRPIQEQDSAAKWKCSYRRNIRPEPSAFFVTLGSGYRSVPSEAGAERLWWKCGKLLNLRQPAIALGLRWHHKCSIDKRVSDG